MPLSVLHEKSHFELLHTRKFDPHHLQIFGFLCFATITNPHTKADKFGATSIPSVMLGYLPSQKGYLLLHMASKQIFGSHDVVFKELIFTFKMDKVAFKDFCAKKVSFNHLDVWDDASLQSSQNNASKQLEQTPHQHAHGEQSESQFVSN